MIEYKKPTFNQSIYINQYKKEHYKTIKVQFLITDDTLKRLETLQSMGNMSRNAIIIDAIKEYLDKRNI